ERPGAAASQSLKNWYVNHPDGSVVVYDQTPVASSLTMSATGQLASVEFGDAIGKSPGRHWDGSRPADAAGDALASLAEEKNHSPLMRIRRADGSAIRNVTSYPVGPIPVCTTCGDTTPCARAAGAAIADNASTPSSAPTREPHTMHLSSFPEPSPGTNILVESRPKPTVLRSAPLRI